MIKIYKASPEDAYPIAVVHGISLKQTYRGIYPDEKLDGFDPERYAQKHLRRIQSPEHHYFVFRDSDAIIGFFSYGPSNHAAYGDFSLCLNHLYVLNGYMGNGLGRQAFSMIRKYCRMQNIPKFFCGCNIHNLPAMAFYRRMGGIQGDTCEANLPKEEQNIHFEFYLGD